MELHELHVLYLALGTVHHCYTVASSDVRICRCSIYSTSAACSHESYFREVSVYLASLWVENVSTETLNVWGAASDTNAHVVLSDDFYSEMVLINVDVGIVSHSLHESALNLSTSVVGMVENAELGVSSFTVEVKGTIFLLVKIHAPLHQSLDACRTAFDHLFYGFWVTDPVACYHCVFDMLLEVIYKQICYGGNTSLCFCSVSFFKGSLAHNSYLTFLSSRYFESVTHTCYSRADDEEIILLSHFLSFS